MLKVVICHPRDFQKLSDRPATTCREVFIDNNYSTSENFFIMAYVYLTGCIWSESRERVTQRQ